MFNLRHRHQKVREHAIQDRIRRAQTRAFQQQLAAEFRRVAKAIAADHSQENQHAVVEQHKRVLRALFQAQYRRVMEHFGKRFHENAKSSGVVLSTKDSEDQYQQRVNRFVERNTAQRVGKVADTTREKIADAVREALTPDVDGNVGSASSLERDIEDALGSDANTDGRAAAIARTETHAASQDAQFDAAQTLGLDLTKEWVSVEDSRTREDHADADGQEQLMHKPFVLGDAEDELMYPGDPSGPADQVINCRCIAVYNDV